MTRRQIVRNSGGRAARRCPHEWVDQPGYGAAQPQYCRLCFKTKKPPKYQNKRIECDGETFDSVKERDRWLTLRIMERHGDIHDLKRQIKYDFIVNGILICSYVADFQYRQALGNRDVK